MMVCSEAAWIETLYRQDSNGDDARRGESQRILSRYRLYRPE